MNQSIIVLIKNLVLVTLILNIFVNTLQEQKNLKSMFEQINRRSQKLDCANSLCQLFTHKSIESSPSKKVKYVNYSKPMFKNASAINCSIVPKNRKLSLKRVIGPYVSHDKISSAKCKNYLNQQPVRKNQTSLNQILQILKIRENESQIDYNNERFEFDLSFDIYQGLKVLSPTLFLPQRSKGSQLIKTLLKTSTGNSASSTKIMKKSLKNAKKVNALSSYPIDTSECRYLKTKNSLISKKDQHIYVHQNSQVIPMILSPIPFAASRKTHLKRQSDSSAKNSIKQFLKVNRANVKNCETINSNSSINGIEAKLEFLRQQNRAMERINFNCNNSFYSSQEYLKLLDLKIAQSQYQLTSFSNPRKNVRSPFRLDSFPHMTTSSRNNTSDCESQIVPIRKIGKGFY